MLPGRVTGGRHGISAISSTATLGRHDLSAGLLRVLCLMGANAGVFVGPALTAETSTSASIEARLGVEVKPVIEGEIKEGC